jgi:hypothetical protein
MSLKDQECRWSQYLKSDQCPKILGLAPVSQEDLNVMAQLKARTGQNHVDDLLRKLSDYPATTSVWIVAMSARVYHEGKFWAKLEAETGYELSTTEHRKKLRTAFRNTITEQKFRFERGPRSDSAKPSMRQEFLFQAGIPLCLCEELVKSIKAIERAEGLPDADDTLGPEWLREKLLAKTQDAGTLHDSLNGKAGQPVCEAVLGFLNGGSIQVSEALRKALEVQFNRENPVRRKSLPRFNRLREKEAKLERRFLSEPRLVIRGQDAVFECRVDQEGLELPEAPADVMDARVVVGTRIHARLCRDKGGPWRLVGNNELLYLNSSDVVEVRILYGPEEAEKIAATQELRFWHGGCAVSRYGANMKLHPESAGRQLPVGEAFCLLVHPEGECSRDPDQLAALPSGWKVWSFNQGWAGFIEVRGTEDSDPWWSSAWVETEPKKIPDEIASAEWWLVLEKVTLTEVHARVCWSQRGFTVETMRIGAKKAEIETGNSSASKPFKIVAEDLWSGCALNVTILHEGVRHRLSKVARVYLREHDDDIALLRDNEGKVLRLDGSQTLVADQIRSSRLMLLQRRHSQKAVSVFQAGRPVGTLDECQARLETVMGRGAALQVEIGTEMRSLTAGVVSQGFIRNVTDFHVGLSQRPKIHIELDRALEVSASHEVLLAFQVLHPNGPRLQIFTVEAHEIDGREENLWTVGYPNEMRVLLGVAICREKRVIGSWLADLPGCSWAHPFTSKALSNQEAALLAAFAKQFNAPILDEAHQPIVAGFIREHFKSVLFEVPRTEDAWLGQIQHEEHALSPYKLIDTEWPRVFRHFLMNMTSAEPSLEAVFHAFAKATTILNALQNPWVIRELCAFSPLLAVHFAKEMRIKDEKSISQVLHVLKQDISRKPEHETWCSTRKVSPDDVNAAIGECIACKNLQRQKFIGKWLWDDEFCISILLRGLDPKFELL